VLEPLMRPARQRRARRRDRGFTLIEMLIGIALVAIVLAVGIPSMQRFIVNNRLKAVNSQLVNDLNYARTEAAARNMPVYWVFGQQVGQLTCYTLFTSTLEGAECDCTLGAGAACANAALREIRTVQIPMSGSVRISVPLGGARMFAFDHLNGGMYYGTTDFGDAVLADFIINTFVSGDNSRNLRTYVSPAGRTKVCSFGATPISGYPAC
jgi:type IV fimbrial biogenesis protein FimT